MKSKCLSASNGSANAVGMGADAAPVNCALLQSSADVTSLIKKVLELFKPLPF